MKGFRDEYICWIKQIVQSGNMAVRVNDQLGPFLKTKKGLRQGDPMSPILFNIVVDVLQELVCRAISQGELSGVVPNLVDGGLVMLQYADDTVFLIKAGEENAIGP